MNIEFKNVKVGQKFSINGDEYIKHNEFKAKRAEDHWKSSPHLWDIYRSRWSISSTNSPPGLFFVM